MANWYLQSGETSDVVISSRIRLARNLNDIPFVNRYTKEEAKQVIEKVKQTIRKNWIWTKDYEYEGHG